MAEWSIQEVGKTATGFFKKYPWLAWGGLAVAGGAGLYIAYKKSREGAAGGPAVPASYAGELPPAGTGEGLDAGAVEQKMRELLEEQGLMNRALLEELAREWQAGYTELAETVRSYLEAGAPAGAYLPRDYYYLYQPQPQLEPVSPSRAAVEQVEIPPTLTGVERLYTERQARTILEWAGMETAAQKAGYRGTSLLSTGLAEASLTVTYHPTGYVEFVPKGEKPSPTPPPAPGTPEYKIATQTEAESIGARIAMLQKAYEGASKEQKAVIHAEAEKLRQQAAAKGIAQEVEKARISTWQTVLGGT